MNKIILGLISLVIGFVVFSCQISNEINTYDQSLFGSTPFSFLPNDSESSIRDNYKKLVDKKASNLQIKLVKQLSAKMCKKNGIKGACAEVVSFKDNGNRSIPDGKIISFGKNERRKITGENAVLIVNTIPYLLRSSNNNVTIIKPLKKLKNINKIQIKKPSNNDGGPKVNAMINPYIYEFFTGNECCADCWAIHRSYGLPCYMDYACCNVIGRNGPACGQDPGCKGGGNDDGPDGPGGNDDDDNCPSEMDMTVNGWSIDVGGAICKYDGMVEYVDGGDGECVPVATDSGVVYDCVSTTNGGPIDNELDTESENGF